MVKGILYGNCMGKANCMGKIMAIFFREFEAKRRRPYKAHTKFKMFANFEALYLGFSLVLHDAKGFKWKLSSRAFSCTRSDVRLRALSGRKFELKMYKNCIFMKRFLAEKQQLFWKVQSGTCSISILKQKKGPPPDFFAWNLFSTSQSNYSKA